MKSARSVKFASTVSVQSQMDGNCVKYKLYGRWKNTVCTETQIVWKADGHKHFHWIEARVPVRPLYPSGHFPDHPLPNHLDHLHPHPASCLFLVLSFLPKSYNICWRRSCIATRILWCDRLVLLLVALFDPLRSEGCIALRCVSMCVTTDHMQVRINLPCTLYFLRQSFKSQPFARLQHLQV